MLRRIANFSALLFLMISGFLLMERWFSPTFQNCTRDSEYNDASFGNKNEGFLIGSVISSYIRCSGSFTDRHGAGIAALASTVIAAFTATLWVATRRQAQLTKESIQLTREAFTTTERAFVYCERIHSKWTAKKENEEIVGWTFTPIWRNSGKTPTKGALSVVNTWVGVDAGELPDDFIFPDYSKPGRNMIGAGATMEGLSLNIPLETLQKMRIGGAHAYIWGWFDYNDIFAATPRHRAEFCLEIQVIGNPLYKEGGFAYRVHGRFNGFDEDCHRRPEDFSQEI